MDKEMIKKIALFRFSLIAPVVNDTYQASSKTKYYEELAKKKHQLPNGEIVIYAPGTFKAWYLVYCKKGFKGLYPKTRSDLGKTRTLDMETKHRIHQLKEKFPHMTATILYQKLLEEGYITIKSTSLSTITRYVRKEKLKPRQLVGKQRRAFEMEHVNYCWQADTSHAVTLTINGKKFKTYLIVFLDDASRMIVGWDFFFNDSAVNVQKVFKKAVQTYGLPSRIYVDNGPSYANEQLSIICASLGVTLIHTQAYDAAAKGKVERYFKSAKLSWLRVVEWSQFHSIEDIKQSFEDYLKTQYLNKKHSSLGKSPKERFMEEVERIKYMEPTTLYECFLHTEYRTVRNDSTIVLQKTYYEVPQQYIGDRIKIKYDPENKESLYIYEGEKRKEEIKELQRVDNSKVKRVVIDYRQVGGE